MNLERLKEIREEHEDSQQDVANFLNVKRGTYASWECGSDTISTRKLFEFAKHYNCSMDYLLRLSNNKSDINYDKDINLAKIGKKLKNIRVELGLSQAKMAESIGINQSTWWGYENGKTLITLNSLYSLSIVGNKDIDKIFKF